MNISILGTGAYGIALAHVFYSNNNKVCMWTKFQEELDTISLKRENSKVLPGIKIPDDINITCNLEECIKDSDIIVIAVPSNTIRGVVCELGKYIKPDQIICIASKGMENEKNKFMSQVIEEEIPNSNICVVSGPSFAIEIANDAKLGLIAASKDNNSSMAVKLCLENDNVIVNTCIDVIGVQICASVKNVFAIILGMLNEKEDSTKATMLTILLKDMKIIVEVLGGKEQTVYNYAGIGDFLLTSMSDKSRNYTFGKNIAKGYTKDEAFEIMQTKTVEGIFALKSIKQMLDQKEIEIESINTLYSILYNGQKVEDILKCIK